jgi:hypothetical protein
LLQRGAGGELGQRRAELRFRDALTLRQTGVVSAFAETIRGEVAMSTTTKSKAPSTPDQGPVASMSYADDIFGWVTQQIELLRAGRINEIDADNIAEELSDVAHNQYDKLESALRILLLHFLKWDHQPTHRSKSWVFSVRTQRRHIARVLKKNPSLRPHIAEAIAEAYSDACDEAEAETGVARKIFELTCPYGWDAILTRAVEFEGIRSPEE